MPSLRKIGQGLLIFSLLLSMSCSRDNSIKIGITTTLDDAGLLTILVDEFKQEHDITVKPIIAGSGQIHRLLERGDIDSAITHDPNGEKLLLQKGIIDRRLPLMSNDFVIIGPQDDPAHIQHALTPDEALEKIAYVGANFVSRGDDSGTHQMENHWRQKINFPESQQHIIKTGSGMGATLMVAIDKQAYTLVDRGTWLNFNHKQNARILFENSDDLPNHYSLLSVNRDTTQNAPLTLWEDWLTQGKGLELIREYRIQNQAIFNVQQSTRQ